MINKDPLVRAIRSKDLSYVSQLLQSGASAHANTVTKYYPMHAAAQFNAVQEISVLQQFGASVNEEDHFGQTPVHVAASHGAALAMKKMLLLGANVQRTDRNGNTPLHLAAHLTSGRVQQTLIEDLIQNGADVNAVNNDGVTPLHLAAQSGSVSAVTILLQHRANPAAITTNKRTVVDFARSSDQKSIQDLLQKHGSPASQLRK